MLRRLGISASVLAVISLLAGASVVAAAPGDVAPASDATTTGTPLVAGEVLVAMTPATTPGDVVDRLGATQAHPVPHRPDILVVEVAAGQERSVATLADALDGVRWASPNFIASTEDAPDDPGYVHQWNLGTHTRALGAANWQPVHGTGVTGEGVTVAVVDTGVTPNEDLDGVVAGYDFVDDDDDPSDNQGHGTHVAGTVAQTADNGVGVAGVAPDAGVLAVRALDATGRGTYADLLSAIALAVDRGASVLNLSFGGGADGGLCDAVERAVGAGAVVVAAAGNSAGPVAYPAACPAAIAVSATSIAGTITEYSNSGPEIDLAAPGGDTATDLDADGAPDGILQYSVFNGVGGYYYSAGTSMSAPHVSGAAALLLDVDPTLSPAQVRAALQASAVDLGVPGDDPLYGAGLLDIAAAVGEASSSPPPPTDTEPAPLPGPSPAPAPDTEPEPEAEPAPDTSPTQSRTASRVSGEHRYATSVSASRTGFQGGADRAFIASGKSFPDALAASALADVLDAPVLLTEPCALPGTVGDELERLGPAEVLVIGGPGAVCEEVAVQAAVEARAPVRRLAGANRYETAAALAREGFDTAPSVFIAAGHTFADSLPGGAAAARRDGPLLLTERCRLPDATRQALERLQPAEVFVLGGAGAICDSVLGGIEDQVPGTTVRRIAGADRYATAASAARTSFDTAPAVIVASGTAFPDGLSGGGLAAVLDVPLLLVPRCAVPAAVHDAVSQLGPERILVLGGDAAICEDVPAELVAGS